MIKYLTKGPVTISPKSGNKPHTFSTTAVHEEGNNQAVEEISVIFVDNNGEKHIKVPVGMSILEAAHEHDIELEGACEGSCACSTCHVIVRDMEYFNKLEDPNDEENDMLDLAFGLTETSCLGCQVIATPELDGMCLELPAATRNFAVLCRGQVCQSHLKSSNSSDGVAAHTFCSSERGSGRLLSWALPYSVDETA